jgi:uncharacterized membrane protein
MDQAGSHGAPARYDVTPYLPDGSCSLNSVLLTTNIGAVVGVVVGALASLIGCFFYLVLVFPMAVGAAIGASQKGIIRWTRIRNPLACTAAAIVAGAAAVFTSHYVDYLIFQRNMRSNADNFQTVRMMLAASTDAQEREAIAGVLKEYENDPEVAAAMNVQSFAQYMVWSAHQGVEIGSVSRTAGSSNLGFTGTIIYWLVEGLIVAGFPIFMTRSATSMPYCEACNEWRQETVLGTVHALPRSVSQAVTSGELGDLHTLAETSNREARIKVFTCPHCEPDQRQDVVVQVEEVTYYKRQPQYRLLSSTVYPLEALGDLNAFFVDPTAKGVENLYPDLEPEVAKALMAAK